jgi:hypothetical protein
VVALLGNLIPTPDMVQHEVYLDDGPDGPQWAVPEARQARVEAASKRIQTTDGRVITLTSRIYLLGHEGEVKVGDRLNGRTVETIDAPTWWNGDVMHYEAGVT